MMLRPRITRIGLSFATPRRALHFTPRRRNGMNGVPPVNQYKHPVEEAINNDYPPINETDFMNDIRRNPTLGMDTLDRNPQADFENDIQQGLHVVPLLGEDFTNGIPDFLSPAAFDMAWTQYQSLMVEKLNMLTSGGLYESKAPKDIAIKFARDPNSAPVFNHASMAHNNNFFFSCLSSQETIMPGALKADLESSFSSIETLRQEMIVTASSMFGPGFVWLVKSKQPGPRKYYLLNTYLAGSPYAGAHYRKQSVDMNTENSDPTGVLDALPRVNSVGSHGQFSKPAKTVPAGGIDLNPILCINTWEHVYLPDYGVGAGGVGGKRAYAERWWDRINWTVVANNAELDKGGPTHFLT